MGSSILGSILAFSWKLFFSGVSVLLFGEYDYPEE